MTDSGSPLKIEEFGRRPKPPTLIALSVEKEIRA